MAFVGEIPELGEWKQAKAFLKRDHQGLWVLKQPIFTKRHYFKAKFAVYDPHAGLKIQFERGIDRLFDLALLPALENENDPRSNTHNFGNPQNVKNVFLHCEWEAFTVTFSCSVPLEGLNDELIFDGDK